MYRWAVCKIPVGKAVIPRCTGGLYQCLVETDTDGLYSGIVRQLLATVLRLDDEEISHDVGLKELKGQS